MTLHFYKYQGTGNDFVMIDNRNKTFNAKDEDLIRRMCDRRFGIGGDGLILLQNHDDFDFEMLYFNADGSVGSMCGNGGRCIVAFAHFLKIIDTKTTFLAIDGRHEAKIKDGLVDLKMIEVEEVEEGNGFYYLNTGSPHYVRFIDDLDAFDVFEEGRKVRYSARFKAEGTNVNFVEPLSDGLKVATYERGVENETFSCGTGVVASAITHFLKSNSKENTEMSIFTKGGNLKVKFESEGSAFSKIWLSGPAKMVFEGDFRA